MAPSTIRPHQEPILLHHLRERPRAEGDVLADLPPKLTHEAVGGRRHEGGAITVDAANEHLPGRHRLHLRFQGLHDGATTRDEAPHGLQE